MTARFHPLERGYQITSGFGWRAFDNAVHKGIDFGWPGGSGGRPVFAAQGGTVQYAGPADGYGGPDPAGWIVIDSDDAQGGGAFEYGHVIREVKVGDRIAAGQRIGRINPNQNTNGGVAPHLHVSWWPRAHGGPEGKQDWRRLLDGATYPGEVNEPATPKPTPNPGGTVPAIDYGVTRKMYGFNAGSAGTGNSDGPRGRTPYLVWHTQQAKSTAVDLAAFCNNSATGSNPVSYNFAVDGRDTIEIVPVNEGPWAAAAANNIGVHACFAGSFAEWTRTQWLDTADDSGDGLSESLALDRAAKIAVAANLQYGIPLVYAGDGGRSGWPVLPKGNVGHRDFGQRGGGHTDPGNGFPMDELLRRAQALLVPAPNLIDIAAKVAANWIGKRITVGEGNTRPAGSGKVALFDNAAIYYKQGAPAAIPVPKGGLFEAYASYDYEAGALGFPTRGHTVLPDGGVQAFEGGVLFRKNGSDRGLYVTGAIGKKYAATGWEAGPWGWPITNETPGPDGTRIQAFENVTATWSPDGVVTTGKES